MMLELCERFGCLPSQLEREDVRVIRMLRIVAEAQPPEQDGSDA